MGVGAEGGLAHLAQQVEEAGRRREVRPQHQGVDEEADQPLGLGAVAVGDRRADRQVAAGRSERESSASIDAASTMNGVAPSRRASAASAAASPAVEREAVLRAAVRRHGGARAVGGQLERRRQRRAAAARQ